MKFAITENDIREITLKTWDGNCWSPDFFLDMEVNFPACHDILDGDDAIICTAEEYTELLAWWTQYVDDVNNRAVCDNGDDYTEYTGGDWTIFTSTEI